MVCFSISPVNDTEGFGIRIEENVVRISFPELIVTDTEIMQSFNNTGNFVPGGTSESGLHI